MSANRNSAGANYYYIDQSQPVSLWRVLLRCIGIVMTLALSVALIMAYLSTGISPERNWVFAFFGLGAPFLFLGNILMMLLWIIRWSRWALVPTLTLLIGVGHLGTLVQFDFRKEYPTQTPKNQINNGETLSILTYNVHGFTRGETQHSGYLRNADSIAAYIRQLSPDIICFQEYETMQPADVEHLNNLYRDWPYRSYNFIYGGENNIGYGTAIFSRLPILNARRMIFEESANSLLTADLVDASGDTLRLFNNHLQSTQVDETSQDRVERLDMRGEEGAKQFVRSLGARLKTNYRRRATQVDTVSRMIAASSHPVVVLGDFNDTPVSYTYKKMRGHLEDTFINAGCGFAYTYNRLFSMLRIDYIFHSSVYTTLEYRSDDLKWSDHNPVFVRLHKKRPK